MSGDPDHAEPPAGLQIGALSLPMIIMQAITSVGPALTVFVTFQPGIALAGIDAPLVYLVDVFIVLMLGSTLVHLARSFPSAGGYFTYVTRTLGPRAGVKVSWAFMLYSAVQPGVIFAYLGRLVSTTLSTYGLEVPWGYPFAATAVIAGTIIYRGIEFSGRSLMVIGIVEIGIVVVFCAWGFALPHDGSISFAPLDPHHISVNDFALAAVFGMFVYTGWESIAPIAEESANPRRNIPIATRVSILFSCALITFSTWGMILSWGASDIASVPAASAMPAMTLAHRLWGPLWWLVLFAIANSIIGAGVGLSLVSSRMWLAMGRVGLLPAQFARIHRRFLTPSWSTWVQIALYFIVAAGGAALVGIDNLYLVGGLIGVFAAILIYIAANLGLTHHMWRRCRSAFRWIPHALYPVVSTAALLILCYKSLFPLPSFPVLWAPLIVGGWMLLGIVTIVVAPRLLGSEWLLRAAALAAKEE